MSEGQNKGLIDYPKLKQAYEENRIYALQLEVGDLCYQNCLYCYMNALPDPKNTLGDEEIYQILKDSHQLGITAIEWLGGEPLLRSNILTFLEKAKSLGFRNNIWTGGLPLSNRHLSKELVSLASPGLIAVHLSTINPHLYEYLHPGRTKDDMYQILRGVEFLLEEGYPPQSMLNSVTYTGLQPAEDMIETIDFFEDKFSIKTSLNIYHTYLRPGTPPGEFARFIPPPSGVSRVRKRIALQWGLKQLPMNCVNKEYCSSTMAVLCDGNVTPCATIRPADAPNLHRDGNLIAIFEKHRAELTLQFFRNPENLPQECQRCRLNDHCFGCRSRAYAEGFGLYGKDPRCPRRIRS